VHAALAHYSTPVLLTAVPTVILHQRHCSSMHLGSALVWCDVVLQIPSRMVTLCVAGWLTGYVPGHPVCRSVLQMFKWFSEKPSLGTPEHHHRGKCYPKLRTSGGVAGGWVSGTAPHKRWVKQY